MEIVIILLYHSACFIAGFILGMIINTRRRNKEAIEEIKEKYNPGFDMEKLNKRRQEFKENFYRKRTIGL